MKNALSIPQVDSSDSASKERNLSLGLDFGTSALRYVLADPRGPKIISWGSYELDAEPTRKGKPSKEFSGLVSFLKDLAKRLPKARIRQINVKLPAHVAFTGTVEIPAVSKKDSKHLIELAVAKQIDFPIEKAALCYTEISPQAKVDHEAAEGKMVYSFAAAPKTVVMQLVETVQEAFIPVPDVTIQGYAHESLVNLFSLVPAGETLAFIDIGKSATIISVFQNQRFVFERNIPIGGQDLTRAIMIMYLNTHSPRATRDLHEAEQLKRKSYIPHDRLVSPPDKKGSARPEELLAIEENQRLFKAMEGILTALLHDIRLTLNFFAEKNKGQKVSKIYLMGSGAELRYFVDYLSEKLEIETNLLTFDPQRVSLGSLEDGETFRREFHRYATAFAMSLKPPDYASMTPGEYSTAALERFGTSLIRIAVAVTFAVFLSWYFYLSTQDVNLQFNRKLLWEYQAPLKRIEQPYLEMMRWRSFLTSTDNAMPAAAVILKSLSQIAPSNVVFGTASIDRVEGTVLLEGVVLGDVERRAVTMKEFSKLLEDSQCFRNTSIRSLVTTSSGINSAHFQVTLELEKQADNV